MNELMSYSINGKVYTEHPLLDEIVYNCKLIVKDLVIKNEELGNRYESEESIANYECGLRIKDGTVKFSNFPLSKEALESMGCTSDEIVYWLKDREYIPEDRREEVMEYCNTYFMDHYEELNKYYRTLQGLPEYDSGDEYYVYIDESYLPANYYKEIDFSTPLHELDRLTISILFSTGKMDEIIAAHPGFNYAYIRFLGEKSIDIFTSRKAGKYDIIYMPSVESSVTNRFRELYNTNKEIYLKRVYQDAYAFESDYYEHGMIIMIICQTINDMIVDIPEWYIRRDIFDIRSVQYFLESYGVEFFKEIPMKYQIRIVKNLNKLIQYKSSNRNNFDILDIFALANTSIYKYYLYKKRIYKGNNKYATGDKDEDKYELEFVQTELGDTYDNFIKDPIYRTKYDDITYQDKYWDGKDTHECIRNYHLNRDFTIEGTKYMSVEYHVPLSDYTYQLEFFLGLLLDSTIDTGDITIGIPDIQESYQFRISDLFLFLVLLSLAYDDSGTDVIRPKTKPMRDPEAEKKKQEVSTDDNSISKRDMISLGNIDSSQVIDNKEDNKVAIISSTKKAIKRAKRIYNEDFYDWMHKYYPEAFITGTRRINGFNMEADLDLLREIIKINHGDYGFRKGYTLEDMLDGEPFITSTKITTIEELMRIYNQDKKCYEILQEKLLYGTDDRDEGELYQFVFDYLFTKPFDYDFYRVDNGKIEAKKVEEVLGDRDYILYNTYTKIIAENNIENRKDNIRNIMNTVITNLEYYLDFPGLDYLFGFTAIASFSALTRYIYLMINFFKSYKTHFLDPYITYTANDATGNNAAGQTKQDALNGRHITYWKSDKYFCTQDRDVMVYTSIRELEDRTHIERQKEVLDVWGHYEGDPYDDNDYNGMYPKTQDSEYVKQADGGNIKDNQYCIPYIMLNGGTPSFGSQYNLMVLVQEI